MKIRVYRWEEHVKFNALYQLMHSKELRSEHKYGVSKIEYEADNGKVHTFIPLGKQYFNASHVNAVIFKCKNCNTAHVLLREDNVSTQVHFANPCHCGNINTDSYRASGCLVCYRQLPVFERITDYTYNSKHETKVERVMDEGIYNNLTNTILQVVTG